MNEELGSHVWTDTSGHRRGGGAGGAGQGLAAGGRTCKRGAAEVRHRIQGSAGTGSGGTTGAASPASVRKGSSQGAPFLLRGRRGVSKHLLGWGKVRKSSSVWRQGEPVHRAKAEAVSLTQHPSPSPSPRPRVALAEKHVNPLGATRASGPRPRSSSSAQQSSSAPITPKARAWWGGLCWPRAPPAPSMPPSSWIAGHVRAGEAAGSAL